MFDALLAVGRVGPAVQESAPPGANEPSIFFSLVIAAVIMFVVFRLLMRLFRENRGGGGDGGNQGPGWNWGGWNGPNDWPKLPRAPRGSGPAPDFIPEWVFEEMPPPRELTKVRPPKDES